MTIAPGTDWFARRHDGMVDGRHNVYIKGNDVVDTVISLRADAMGPECEIVVKDVTVLGGTHRLGTDRAQWADLSAEKTVTFAHTF